MNLSDQERALVSFQKQYRNGAYAGAIVTPQTIEDLCTFSKKNAVVFGFAIAHAMKDMVPTGKQWKFDAAPLFLKVAFRASNIHKTTKELNIGHGVNISDGANTTRVTSSRTVHGISFTLTVTWTFGRGGIAVDMPEPIVWTQNVVKEPYSPYTVDVSFPAPREFELGALFHLAHLDRNMSEDMLRVDMFADDGSPCIHPRHNNGVDKIMHASDEMQQLVDHHATALAYFVDVSEQFSRLTVPWSVHTIDKQSPTSLDCAMQDVTVTIDAAGGDNEQAPLSTRPPLVDNKVFALMAAFHASREEEVLSIGNVSVLVQKLYILKLYVVHFSNCFDLIEEKQVRAFLSGIGKVNATLFDEHRCIDRLLLNVSAHKALHSEHKIELKACYNAFTACSIRLEVRLPDEKSFSTVHAIEKKMTINDTSNTIKFRGPSDEGVVVVGTLTQRVFILPTARPGDNLPTIQLSAGSSFGQPVLVSIGAMGGAASTGTSLFLFGDGLMFQLALSVAALPSNATFESSMALLPTEMRLFASSIRVADLRESGLCIDVIETLPLLAKQLGIDESDLVGRRDIEQRLLNLIKMGVSLASIRATPRRSGCNPDTGSTTSYNIDTIMQQVDLLEKAALEQGALDQDRKRKHVEMDRAQYSTFEQPQYRSMGAAPVYRSLPAKGGMGNTLGARQDDEPSEDDGERDDSTFGQKNDDVMGSLLTSFGDTFRPNDFSACKIDMGNPCDTMQFAQTIMPDKKGGWVEPPHKRDWFRKGAEANVMRDALIEFVEKSDGPIKTTRICYYGMYAHTEPALLTHLLSGGKDPCATHADMFKVAQSTLVGMSASNA